MAEWIEYTQSWDDTDDAVWPVLALAASAESELLYAGDSSGRLSMYTLGGAGLPLNRHASVQCAQAPLQRVAALARGRVFVQSDDTVQVLTDGGRQAFKRTTLPNDGFTMAAVDASGAQAFVCTSAGAGSLLDLEAGRVVRRTLIEPSVGAAHFGDFLVLGTAGGEVVARDARAPKSMVWAASPLPGAVTDIAGHGMQIYVCRSRPSAGQLYQTEADPTVRVYDVRGGAQPVDSIECSGGAPAWLQVCGGALWIGHTSGYAEARQLSRLGDDEAGHLYIEPALDECAGVTGFAVSPSVQAALIADSEGVLHVWASSDRPQLSIDGRASDAVLPDEAAATGPVGGEGIDIGDESVPLSCVGMPATAERLLSFMDNDVRWDVGRPVNYVDPAILGSMQMMGAIGYAPNPRTRRRNQQPFGRQWRATWKQGTMYDDSELTQGVAKFRSQQRYGGRRAQPAGDGGPVRSNLVPTQLRQMQIEYSRFGVEDFDFSLYNSTRWSGLEGDMRNAYANALLQLLYFTPEFRALMLAHCASACAKPTCLSCQLGFLFRMLDTANGASCHAAMLLQVLEERPDASALALLEDQPGGLTGAAAAAGSGGSDSYAPLAQRLLRFVLEQANSECKHLDDVLAADADPGRRRIVERVFGVRQLTRLVCTACDTPQERESHVLSVDLDPPQGLAELDSVLAGGMASVARADALRSSKKASLPQLVERALAKSAKAKGWCAGCRKFQLLQTDKSVTGPPAGYMVLNFTGRAGPAAAAPVADGGSSSDSAAATATGAANEWQMSLPTALELETVPGVDGAPPQVRVHAGASGDGPGHRLQLTAVVSEIRDQPRGPGHLVVHVRNPDNPRKWLLFNDFLVQPVGEESVVGLYDWWRTPSVAVYASADRAELAAVVSAVVQRHPYKFSTRCLTAPSSSLDQAFPPLRANPKHDARAAEGHLPTRNETVALSDDEAAMLERGDFVCALDAEFVVLEEAVTEESSDGTCHVHRPPMYTMARLSAVRANGGPLHGVPFIDDYVATSRVVADLVTPYSGIHIGDLTPGISTYQLSTMKEVYRKLRLLVDSGCTIIGHGLARDFRVCNIIVPASQVRDTMLLFQSSANPRAVSLRFLYWYFYKQAIQSGEHSSVEDSQATLKVYESYLKAKDAHGSHFADDVIGAIYAQGERTSWRIPNSQPPPQE